LALRYLSLTNLNVHPDGQTTQQLRKKAKEAIDKAMMLAPDLPSAYSMRGLIKTYVDWDWKGAELDFLHATELTPRASDPYEYHSYFLQVTGRYDEALHEIEMTRQINLQMTASVESNRTYTLICARRYDEAVKGATEALVLFPDYYLLHVRLAQAYLAQERYSEAISE